MSIRAKYLNIYIKNDRINGSKELLKNNKNEWEEIRKKRKKERINSHRIISSWYSKWHWRKLQEERKGDKTNKTSVI